MADTLQITLTDGALATLRTIAAVRGQPVAQVLAAAISHEEWLTQCTIRQHPVYAEGPTYRDELCLPQPRESSGPGAST